MSDQERVILEETVSETQRLRRHVLHDPQSRDYQAERKPVISVVHSVHGLPLNQGNVGSCTAEALIGALNTDPDFNGAQPHTQDEAYKLYHAETVAEGQPWPPNDPGGSGLIVCKAAKQMGLMKSYQHAFGVQHALEALMVRPVITGVDWFAGFDHPDANGLVQISGPIRAGHEVLVVEVNIERQLVGLVNSWGSQHGLNGRFYWSIKTWDTLLRRQGVTVPIA